MQKLRVNNLSFQYATNSVLKDVNFTVDKGECVAILGTNGVGKSTLLKCLNRILRPQQGSVELEGEDINSMGRNELARKVGYVAQKNEFSHTTVFDAVLLGRKPYIKWDISKEDVQLTKGVMEKMSLSSFAMRKVNQLSGGEMQKVAIARALTQQPSILLFDEPTSNLDLKNQLEVITLIRSVVAENGLSALVTMHDLNLAIRFADKYIFMREGEIFTWGGKEILTEENIRSVYEVDVDVQYHKGSPVVIPQ
jgi:iron complex transport system ATP-binding protein